MATPASEDRFNFPKAEENVLELWKRLDAFQSCLKQSKSRPRYTFYDGPPFATGLPHYGHILAGTVKDIVTRWAHQCGYHVERRFGWDCHGLPVEYEIDKILGIKGPEDVEKLGIGKYNQECRKIVMRYSADWERIMSRLGRWIDFKNDYKTMYPWFMESIWWVFKQLYDKGLVYKGFKVMPFSTACNTPLSNFEAGQNYKDVQDPTVIVSFPLEEDPDVMMLAWTTTPWTLPSNLALCVHPEHMYVKVADKVTGQKYIVMEARLSALPNECDVLDRFKGLSLQGKRYKPLFNYFEHMAEHGAFQVLTDTYVTEESGTGVVHQAPYFGEDDYRIALKCGIITKDMTPICPVDMSGRFVAPVTDFEGQYVKDADKNIVKWLKEKGRLVHYGTMTHSYPFCWRSDTPLLYKAVPSWFVRVEHMAERLLESNKATYWVPEFVKEKRFANWLRDARDWAISRNRYWGNPIPLWTSEDGEEVVCVGSIEELERLTGATNVKDLHREYIDELTIPSRCGKGQLRRVSEVFDCWFESGSMPYAQRHYPFERRKDFDEQFPGDFISEGIDQTRGWFYTLLVLSTSLFGKAPFKNLICHGLVLASDGQKMSKRKKNYPDPMLIVDKYGADAVRLYLINSPVVRADNLRFKEEGVRDVLKDVFLPWFNAHRFLMQNIERLKKEEGVVLEYSARSVEAADNYMDRWIISFMQTLIKFVKQEMAAYRLYTVVPRLIRFVEQLTNWYVRMNRRRLKGERGAADCCRALNTLFSVLLAMNQLMAPFIPFLTEHMYQDLRPLMASESSSPHRDSVHYLMLPEARDSLIHPSIEKAVATMQCVIDLGRVIRERKVMPIKYPLKEVVVICKDEQVLADIASLEKYILVELNVRVLTTTSDKRRYGVRLRAEPDHRVLGARLKGAFKGVVAAIRQLTDDQLAGFQQTSALTVEGHALAPDDLRLMYVFDGAADGAPSRYEAYSENEILVLLDVTPDQQMVDEGLAREVINRIQRLRKKAKLVPSDEITVFYEASDSLSKVIVEFSDYIDKTVKVPLRPFPVPDGFNSLISDTATVKGDSLQLVFIKGFIPPPPTTRTAATSNSVSNGVAPVSRFVNVLLCGVQPEGGATGTAASVFLENPVGDFPISMDELRRQVQIIFGLQRKTMRLYRTTDRKTELTNTSVSNIFSLHTAQLYAFVE